MRGYESRKDLLLATSVFIVTLVFIIAGAFIIVAVTKNNLYDTIYDAKMDVLRDSTEETKEHIDNMRLQLREANPDWTEDRVKDTVTEWIRDFMYSMEYSDESYMWIHEIKNYDGGDKYAERLINPNFRDYEGELLSTNTVDKEGNMPYKTELDGIKKDGSVLFTCNLKEFNSDIVTKRVIYSSLYPDYNWVISRGVSFNRLDKVANDSFKSILPELIGVVVIYGIVVIALLIYTITLARRMLRLKETKSSLDKEIENAQMASKAKINFLFNISHDVRSYMENVLRYTDLASENLDNEKAAEEYLNKSKESAEKLDGIITEAGKMALLESEGVEFEDTLMDIREYSEDVNKVIEKLSNEKHITLNVKDSNVSHYKVFGDKMRLKQITMILLTNAIRYTKPGGRVDCVFEEVTSNKEGYALYKLVVSDTGVGMTEGVVKDIFDLVIDDEDKENIEGQNTKLELNVCKRIVESFGGSIKIESKIGRGTKIIVELPLRIVERSNADGEGSVS